MRSNSPAGVVSKFLSRRASIEDALTNLLPSIPEDAHVTMLKKPFTGIGSVGQRDSLKPNGLWYSCGTDWMKWLLSEMPNWIQPYVYTLRLNRGSMLTMSTPKQLLEFTDKYINEKRSKELSFGAHRNSMFIDWPKVARDYSGMEICPYQYSLRLSQETEWYYGWDVASGCVWDGSAIAGADLIYQYDASSDEFKKVF